jgi:aromatic ring-opening dioxygenase LigB subunit
MAVSNLRAAVLMCHAPIVIPALGRRDTLRCWRTTEAMAKAAAKLVASGAERVAVLSPHAPRHPRAFGYYGGAKLRGDFGHFGEPELAAGFEADEELPAAVAEREGLSLMPLKGSLDHGALVPLWFLDEAGWRGKVAVFGFPMNPRPGDQREFGAALQDALDSLGSPWALLASGDCSHRLLPGAPSGYDPRAKDFDQGLATLIREGPGLAPSRELAALREVAGEDVLDSLEIASAALGEDRAGHELLSYEGPFGVGYLVAVLRDAS